MKSIEGKEAMDIVCTGVMATGQSTAFWGVVPNFKALFMGLDLNSF